MSPFTAAGVTVRYGRARGITEVSLDARAGEVLGLLGPNGAGKTTLLRAALDLVHPQAGEITLHGVPATLPKARSFVTYLPGDLNLPRRLTGNQVINRFTANRPPVAAHVINDLADAFGIDLDRRIGSLSKGNRQKVGLVLALAPRTPLLLLDEPTSGLDPLVQQTFAELLAERRANGTTVILSSHVLSELEHLADRVAVLRDGQLVAVETIAALRERTKQRLTVRLASTNDRDTVVERLRAIPGTGVQPVSDVDLLIEFPGSIDPILKALAEVTVVDLQASRSDVEGRLLDYYQDNA